MVATQTLTAKQGVVAFKGTVAKALPTGGTAVLTGKSLGLGLGLGVWGPLIMGLVGAVAVYGYVRSRSAENVQTDEEIEGEVEAVVAEA